MTARLLLARSAVVAALLVFAFVALVTGGGGASHVGSRLPSARSDEQAPRVRVPRSSAPRRVGESPKTAVTTFASVYINWNYADVATRLESLARVSVGQARAAMQLAAAQVAADPTLRGGGIANQGTVEAVGAVAGHPDEWAVVTLEQTKANHSSAYDGLGPAWHVTVATVQRQADGGWLVSGWQPEN